MLPAFGVDDGGHVLLARGDDALDLSRAEGLDVGREVFTAGSLDRLLALGPEAWARTLRQALDPGRPQPDGARRRLTQVRTVLPWTVGDYADFYSSREHAEHMGRLLRPGQDPLPPAWLHLPIGYHGRSGSVVASGTPVGRPHGLLPGGRFGPTERLDVEVELGFVVGVPVPRGRAVGAAEAERHIFGMVLVNDWSARDIQAFEYQPLGPFNSKSFATSVSAWVVPMPVLAPHRVDGPRQEPEPAAYLRQAQPRNVGVDLRLTVNGTPISSLSAAGLYWSAGQQLAHLTVNGAGLRTGDLFASGTISGPEPGQEGSLFERYRGERWLHDGDVVTIEGSCGGHSIGQVTAEVSAG